MFRYAVPWGVRVKGLENVPIKWISALCSPDSADEMMFSYVLHTQNISSLPYSFDDTPLADASEHDIDLIEAVVRLRITEELIGSVKHVRDCPENEGATQNAGELYHTAPRVNLERSSLQATFGYYVTPEVAGRESVRMLVTCTSPRVGKYIMQTTLYVSGKDFGVIDERQIYGIPMTFRVIKERADIIAQCIAEDAFAALVELMVAEPQTPKNETDQTACDKEKPHRTQQRPVRHTQKKPR